MGDETQPSAGAVKVKLSKPITFGDKQVEEIALDFDAVTGADIIFCVNEATAKKGAVLSYVIDTEVHLQLAAKLSGIGREVLLKLRARDFNKVIGPIQAFFLDQD
jgi:hypothetical protein